MALKENGAINPWDTDYDVELFLHEFGHTYQSRIAGPLYYYNWGIPSALLGREYPEHDADYRAYKNFGIWPHGSPTTPKRTNVWDYLAGIFSIFWYY